MLRGACLCGKVAYEIRGTPRLMYYCHCGSCRTATGSSFATNLMVASDEFVLTAGQDLLTGYESSPNKRRWFCSACGSPVYSQAESTKHVLSVRGGTLAGDPGIRPSVHFWVSSKAPWVEITDGLPQMPEGVS